VDVEDEAADVDEEVAVLVVAVVVLAGLVVNVVVVVLATTHTMMPKGLPVSCTHLGAGRLSTSASV